jgi:hypothetical protein
MSGGHAWHTPAWQFVDPQSTAIWHDLPGPHGAQAAPQSMSLSPPLRTPSKQVGSWQTSAVQTSLAQSLGRPHAAFAGQ